MSGGIVAVGRPTGTTECVLMSGETESVFATEFEQDALADLHQTHIVDLDHKLVARMIAAEDQPEGACATT